MEVILRKKIEKLGKIADIVNVAPGYARNFLLRHKFAEMATKKNIALFETQRAHLEAENLQHKQDAEAVSTKMQGVSVSIVRQAGDTGILYGSVRAKDIADALTASGHSINRDQVRIKQTIKTIGMHTVDLVLHSDVCVGIKVVVALTLEEAQTMLTQDDKTEN